MNNFSEAFASGKALLAFITCGDPDLTTTEKAIFAAVEAGADVIEVNIPFSDPTAVDPIVQEANIRALEAGMTTDKVFDFLEAIRPRVQVPFVISTYANVVFSYGADRFAARCARAGVGGLIVPDLPFEERLEFLPQCQAQGIDLIFMVAVTSRQRVADIARQATGFLYITACPGTREQELTELMALARENSSVPCVICLTGTEECRFREVAARTDGVAVDTPIVSLIARHGSACAGPLGVFVSSLKAKLRSI